MAFDILRDDGRQTSSLFPEDTAYIGGGVVDKKDSSFDLTDPNDLAEVDVSGEILEEWIIAMSGPWQYATAQPEAAPVEPAPLAISTLGAPVTDTAMPLRSSGMALYPGTAQ